MQVIPKSLIYYPGDFALSQGCKKGTKAHKTLDGFSRPRSHGWQEEISRSELYLNVLLPNGIEYPIQIDGQIRPIIGRITKKRVAKLLKTLPDEITLVNSKYNKNKYNIFESDLLERLEAAGI